MGKNEIRMRKTPASRKEKTGSHTGRVKDGTHRITQQKKTRPRTERTCPQSLALDLEYGLRVLRPRLLVEDIAGVEVCVVGGLLSFDL